MSLFHIHYASPGLGKQSAMFFTLPEGEGSFPVVYLLHGLSDDYTIWQRRTSIERYAERFGIAIAMLDADRSFYVDTAAGIGNYEQHVLESVHFIDRTFPTIDSPQGRGIGGLSMGGYGSMKLALKHPGVFGSVAAHSGVLDIAEYVANNQTPEAAAVFGAQLSPSEDCFALAAQSTAKPAIYFDCGANDFLIEHNRRFHAHLDKLGIPHTYQEFPGEHTWEYWDEHILDALRFHQRYFASVAH